MPVGATLLEPVTGRGWVLDDAGAVEALGGALAWGRRHDVVDLHLLVDGPNAGTASAVMARRALAWTVAPHVWSVAGRDLVAATPMPVPPVLEPPAAARAWIPALVAHGAEVVVEHGVITAEVLGLEVARVVPASEDLTADRWRVAVGVGHHDREAREEMHPGEALGTALDGVVSLVRELRAGGARRHPANTLARERWLRAVVVAHPELVGAQVLRPVAPPLARHDLRLPAVAPAVGTDTDLRAVVVVCSTGVDLDLVPTAADVRIVHAAAATPDEAPPSRDPIDGGVAPRSSSAGTAPSARLVLVVPEGDDYAVTRDLAGRLAEPAEVVTVRRDWTSLAG